jgi:hypothetical protein
MPPISLTPVYAQPVNMNPTAMVYQGGQQAHRAIPGIVVNISPEARAAYEQSMAAEGLLASPEIGRIECETCNSRRYQDVSNDSSVSFQSPTHIHPSQSAAMVAAHENEHVANEQQRAQQEGREIINQTVSLFSSICPECKRVYISGGETRTTSRDAGDSSEGQPDDSSGPSAA